VLPDARRLTALRLGLPPDQAEAKRQQTLRNSVVLYEDKRRQAEQKVVRVEQQAVSERQSYRCAGNIRVLC
jgi:hypothetical protein